MGRPRKVLLAVLASTLAVASAASLLHGSSGGGAPVEVLVYKTGLCGCCESYIDYLSRFGYTVRVIDLPEEGLESLKAELGIPRVLWSCHTAIIDGYVVEGHVPVEAIERLLAEKPGIAGIAVPGMPPGAPGMPGEPSTLVVYAFNGSITIFQVHAAGVPP